MKKLFLSLAFSACSIITLTAQSLVGNWEFTLNIPNGNTPASIVMNPYLGENQQLAFHCDLSMKMDILNNGTDEGILELTYSADVDGTWKQEADTLSFKLDNSTISTGYSSIMLPNMENEKANKFLESFQGKLDALNTSLRERMIQLASSINRSFVIASLTSNQLSLIDMTGQPITFVRADEGAYDPE